MEKRLKAYIQKMSEMDFDKLSDEERKKVMEDMLIQISFFQHERLIHLIVTALFAVLAIGGLILLTMEVSIGFICLELLFIILLVPYVRHYYILENGVQKLYSIYDRL